MKVVNTTSFPVEDALCAHVSSYEVGGLTVRLTYNKKGARLHYSGVCYYTKDKIRVSINKNNKYPLKIKIGSPFDKASWEYYFLNSAEEAISFVFLHEISHYLDYKNGLTMGCKETKADKFALWKLGKLRSEE